MSAENVASWVNLVVKGRIRPTMRSQPPPLNNFGPLTIVTAATFDELVLNSQGFDVVVLVTASWCVECDPVTEELSKLATSWADEPKLRVATFDAGSNDLPRHLHVQRLPSVLYFPAAPSAASEQPAPLDLSHLEHEAQFTQAVMEQSRLPLTRPVDVRQLSESIDALPELQRTAKELVKENTRLRQLLAASRA